MGWKCPRRGGKQQGNYSLYNQSVAFSSQHLQKEGAPIYNMSFDQLVDTRAFSVKNLVLLTLLMDKSDILHDISIQAVFNALKALWDGWYTGKPPPPPTFDVC